MTEVERLKLQQQFDLELLHSEPEPFLLPWVDATAEEYRLWSDQAFPI